jgi:hypothetical protein
LDLLPGDPDEAIECHIRNVSVDGEGQYEALSYVWGSALEQRENIRVAGKLVQISPNLHDALRRLRSPKQARTLWVDQICINQWDMEEKASQVSLMREIYRNCAHCILWLGEIPYAEHGITEADAKAVFDFIKFVAARPELQSNSAEGTEGVDNKDGLPALFREDAVGVTTRKAFAAFAMYGNPWWERIWTIQESILPHSAEFRWGPLSVPRHDVFLVVQRLRGDRLRSFPSNFRHQRIVHTPLLRSLFYPINGFLHSNEGESGLDLFMRWRHRKATDPRDKIYGLLGLLDMRQISETLPNARARSYSIPTSSLFAMVTSDLLLSGEGLRPLIASSEMPHITPDLPTWSIDFACSNRVGKRQLRWWNHSHRYNQFSACGTTIRQQQLRSKAPAPTISSDWKSLSLNGLLVDEVEQVNTVYEVSDEEDLNYQRMWDIMSSAKKLMAGRDSKEHESDQEHDSLWRTMIGDLVMAEYPVERAKATHASDFLEIERAFQNGEFPQQDRRPGAPPYAKNKLFESLCGMVPNHAFFTTRKGYLGMGPATTSPGDQVWVFYQGNVPFVMRKTNTNNVENGCHDLCLVGDAYVHGVMDGQAVAGEHTTQTAYIY